MQARPSPLRSAASIANALPAVAALYAVVLVGCGMGGVEGFADATGPDADRQWWETTGLGDPEPSPLGTPAVCDTENGTVSQLVPGDPGALAGPAIARFLIRRGQLVTRPVRVREFLDYFGLAAAPPAGARLAIEAALRPEPGAPGSYELQIVLRAADLTAADRRPLNLSLSFDTSDGMQGSPIQRAKQGCVALAATLEAGDVISLVGWDPARGPLLDSHQVTGANDPVLVGHCNAMAASGAAEFRPALEAAFGLVIANASPDRTSRVILVSSGGVQAAADDVTLIARMAAGEGGAEVRLTAVGLGSDAAPELGDDGLLAIAAAVGRGAHFFVDSATETARVFGQRLPAALEPAAEGPSVELALPPTLQLLPEPAEEDGAGPAGPPVLGFGGQAVLRRALASCDPGFLDPGAPLGLTVRYENPAGGGQREVILVTSLSDLLDGSGAMLAKGRAVAAWAEALDDVRDLSGAVARERLDEARDAVRVAIEELGADPELAEIDELIGLYRDLF
jgi:hypothetical protein